MILEKKPQSQFECVNASHGIRNSLDNSFTELSLLPNDTDIFNQSMSFVTSPKELQLGIFNSEVSDPSTLCVKTKAQDSKKTDFDKRMSSILDDGFKEMENDRDRRMSTKVKDQLNLSVKENGQAKYEFILSTDSVEDKRIKRSLSAMIAKKEAEKMNMEMKMLKKKEIAKNEVEDRNMQKKGMEKGKIEKTRRAKMALDEDVDETFLKFVVTDKGGEEDHEEKGSLEIKNDQKDMPLVTMAQKHENCGKADDKEMCEEIDVDTVDEATEFVEKWEDEKGEKMNECEKVSQNEETRKEKLTDSAQEGQFKGYVEISWGEESGLFKKNEIRVKEVLMTSRVESPVKLVERSGVSKATITQPSMEEISVTRIVDHPITSEYRPRIGEAAVYEHSKKIPDNCYYKAKGCEEMHKPLLIKLRSSPVETTGEGNSVLCVISCGFSETISKFQTNHNAVNPTNISWINISPHTYKEFSKPPDQGLSSVGHGDDRNRSGSPGNSSRDFGSLNGKCPAYSRQGSSGGGGGGFGSSGGGGGRDGGDDNWENKRHLDFIGARQKRKQDKKLKKKCRLEHGVLTKEQILFVTGWLLNRSHSVPEAINEMLKCLSIYLQGRSGSIDACEICHSLLLMLRHTSACATEACQVCEGSIVMLCASEHRPGLVESIPEQLRHPGSPAREQLKDDLRIQFAELLSSEDETASKSDDDAANGGRSSDAVDPDNAPAFLRLSLQTEGPREHINEQLDQDVVQGPPDESEGRFNSEFLPYNDIYQSYLPQNGLRNYSLPVDARNARSGSVVYGSKELVRAMVGSWQESAEYQRSPDNHRHHLHHRFVSNRNGVILQSQVTKIRIQNNNYEPEEEWILVTENALGTGVSGSCYACSDCQTGFTFCVKKIPLHKFYADEILIWLEMEHPDIVELYGVIVYDRYVYVIQELIKGPTLKEHISDRKALNSFEALMYLQHLLELLVYLKCKNVIHNDIKADNILVREPGTSTRLVLIDFGLANHMSHVQPGIHPVGGQTHWSPEKAASEGYSFPADLWAAVAVFVHMLGGVEPWVVRFKHTPLLHCIIKQQSPPLQDVPEGLPWQVHRLIVEGWTVDPLARPSPSDLLKNDAFKLLDVDPSMELFVSHLSHVESVEVELPNADSILEESETEELISLAHQHLSLRQQNQQSPSSGLAEMRLSSSTRSFLSSERPRMELALDRPGGVFTSDDRHVVSMSTVRPLQVMPPLEEEEIAFEHRYASFFDQSCTAEARRKYSMPVDNDPDLSETYDDLSLFGIDVFLVQHPSALDDIEIITEQPMTSLSETLARPLEHVSLLHRVNLYATSSPNNAMASAAEAPEPSPSIPTVVEELMLSDEEESGSLQLQSHDGLDVVDEVAIPASSLDVFHNNSMGTTLRMMLDEDQVYCIHLHPRTACSWSEVVRRASTEIHRRGVMSFTAEIVESNRREPVDVSATIPSVPEIRVDTVRLSAFQDGWNWKVEDSKIIYHPNYQGHFGPEFDD